MRIPIYFVSVLRRPHVSSQSIGSNRTASIQRHSIGVYPSWKRLPVVSGSLIALWLLLASSLAQADIIPPAALAPGDQFRLIFVSSATHDAISPDIAVYDAFINGLAVTAGLDLYNGVSVNWYALASTPTVDAITRLPNSVVPIYDMVGNLVADASHDIWHPDFYLGEGGLLHEITYTEIGTIYEGEVRTGTFYNGMSDDPLNAIGSISGGWTGDNREGSCCWVFQVPEPAHWLYPLYGYSEVITVGGEPSSIPEPGTITLLLTAVALLGFGYRPKLQTTLFIHATTELFSKFFARL